MARGKLITKEEIKTAVELNKQEVPVKLIAERMGRTPAAVYTILRNARIAAQEAVGATQAPETVSEPQ